MAEKPPSRCRRRRKLIQPGLQLRLTAKFTGVVILTILLETILASTILARAASESPAGGDFYARMDETMLELLGVSLALIVPLNVLVGVLITFRIAGPVYRLIGFLNRVADGAQAEPCTLRRGDELMDLCEAVNRATAPLRQRDASQPEGEQERAAA